MTHLQHPLTRRALLGAGVLVLAGCTSHHRQTRTDPDAAALEAARAGELAVLASYAEGTPDHDVHLAHLRALGVTTPSPAASPDATSTPAYTDVRASVAVLQSAAVRARAGANAAVFASIAASHAVLTAPVP